MDKKDYEEPCCPMDNSMWVKKKVVSIPVDRVIEKADEYFSKNDYPSAERHFLYWLGEAKNGNDDRGCLVIFNELMGLYRKIGEGEKAKECSQNALNIVKELKLENSISGATSFLNSGTVYKAFNEPEKSLSFFKEAQRIYEKELDKKDQRKAGLYNNMALTLVDLKRFNEAKEYYELAIEIVKGVNKCDEAITYLNLADLVSIEKGEVEAEQIINSYIEKAEEVLDSIPENERDSYFAYVCDKCSPVFGYYGYFLAAQKFKELSEKIYLENNK